VGNCSVGTSGRGDRYFCWKIFETRSLYFEDKSIEVYSPSLGISQLVIEIFETLLFDFKLKMFVPFVKIEKGIFIFSFAPACKILSNLNVSLLRFIDFEEAETLCNVSSTLLSLT